MPTVKQLVYCQSPADFREGQQHWHVKRFQSSFGHLPQSKRRWLEKKTDLKNYLSDISQASTGSEESVQS